MKLAGITAGRNILVEKAGNFYRIHAVLHPTGTADTTVDFFTVSVPDIEPGSLITLSYDCTQPGRRQLFQAEVLQAEDPLFAEGRGNIALVTEYTPKSRTGKAIISGCVSVPVQGKQHGRRFVLPDGSGSFVYSKRGGAEIMLPPKESDDGTFCTVWLGGYKHEAGLYTGAFTVDFADTDGSEYIVYDSAAGSLNQPAGIIAWGDMSISSQVQAPVMKRINDGKGVSLIFNESTLTPVINTLAKGISAYATELANSSGYQLWRGGNIKMWWML